MKIHQIHFLNAALGDTQQCQFEIRAQPVVRLLLAEQVEIFRKMARKRIRQLRNTAKKSSFAKNTPLKSIWVGLKLSFAVILLAVILDSLRNGNLIEELRHLSLNQYHLYVHGRINYCDELFVHANITQELRHQLYGQESVISAIESSFAHHENLTAIALIGSQGVGKTLTLNVIERQFQWNSNVQQYIWSSIESQQSQLKRLIKFLEGLTSCGQNVILIDNIVERYLPIIAEIQNVFETYIQQQRLKVFIFYVIQKDGPNPDNETETINDNLFQMDNITSIYYRRFERSDLVKCIAVECNRLNVKLTPPEIEEIVENIDVGQSGCKPVSARISRYTKSFDSKYLPK